MYGIVGSLIVVAAVVIIVIFTKKGDTKPGPPSPVQPVGPGPITPVDPVDPPVDPVDPDDPPTPSIPSKPVAAGVEILHPYRMDALSQSSGPGYTKGTIRFHEEDIPVTPVQSKSV